MGCCWLARRLRCVHSRLLTRELQLQPSHLCCSWVDDGLGKPARVPNPNRFRSGRLAERVGVPALQKACVC
jgi:hypothetical protein